MVVPAAYGDTGLKKVNIGVGKKRYTGLKVCDRLGLGSAEHAHAFGRPRTPWGLSHLDDTERPGPMPAARPACRRPSSSRPARPRTST